MTPDDVKAAVNAAIDAKVLLTYTQLFAFVLLSGIAAFFGAYIKKKGENLATLEDIKKLTNDVEEIKSTYSKQIEDYKTQLERDKKMAKVAEFFAEWASEHSDKAKLNGLSMELSVWLPYAIYKDLGRCVCWVEGAPSPQQILIDVRKYLLKEFAGDLSADDIVYFK
jgi:hypothetical protein